MEEIVEPGEEISYFDLVDFVKSFCYLGDRLKASSESEAAATARTRIGLLNFRECKKVFVENERINQSCVRLAIL